MKLDEVLQTGLAPQIAARTVVGIDIGSRQAKGVLLVKGEIYCTMMATGFFMQKTAEELLSRLCRLGCVSKEEIQYIVATGYGRVALKFVDIPYQTVTEIACHGKGAHHLGKDIRTIIDIGGQDSKVIRIDPMDGKVINFAMNDKCAAGTGRFLEKIANVLGYDVTEIGTASLKADKHITINSTCVVFAESEVVSARAKGESPENLAAGIHNSVAKRVNGLLSKVGIASNVLFTGGVSNNIGMKHAFEKLLDVRIEESKLNTVFAGALGAAIFAGEYTCRNMPVASVNEAVNDEPKLDLSSFRAAAAKAEYDFIHKTAGKKAYVAYTCNYTPIEILAAANISYIRLMNKGSSEEIIAGENLTQSMQCDFTKSILGGFLRKSPLNQAVEKLYSFNTCVCMRNTLEAVKGLGVPVGIYNLPRRKQDDASPDYLVAELRAFKKDLEELTQEKISDETVREKIHAYNLAKKYMREIAEYRKASGSIVTSEIFQELMHGYYSIPVDAFLKELQRILEQLRKQPPARKQKIRLMLSGGIITNGDTKLTNILEKELDVEIVAEDNCSGMKPLSYEIKEHGEDLYADIARAYLGKAPCSRMYPLQDMLDYSLQLAREYQIDGVVMYYLKFCPCYSMVEKLYTDMYRQNQIPFLIQSGDYSVGDEGQIKTRLEAYIEMIRARKGGR